MVSRFGRYELVRQLGKGGMAEVFLARQRGPGGFEKRLVIKRILPVLAANPRFLRLFFEEARLHASLSHGNLVPIFDFGRVGNDYFLAMELVDGCDLGTLLRSRSGQRLDEGVIAYLGAELGRALQHVHRQRLVHRDLTPRNVLLSLDGEVKLSDFGIAQGAASELAGASGTIAYMAPEQARGESVDLRADLYSLGLVIAELATGARVRASSSGEATEDALRAAGVAAAVSIEGPFAALVARATAPSPSDRFAAAEEMTVAFEALAASLGSSRAAGARALSELVRSAAPGLAATTDEAVSPGPEDVTVSTYYRDATTAGSVVDEIVAPAEAAPPAPSRTPRTRRVALGMLGMLAAAAVALGLARHAELPAPRAPVPAPAPRAEPPRPTELAVPSIAPVPAAPAAPRPRAAPSSTGAVEIVCKPWCVVDVDGQRRGEDGRHHLVRLSVGHHRISVERLEDRQTRAIDIGADRTDKLEFAFD